MWLANLFAQICGLVGFLLLSIPAFHAAKYGKLLVDAAAAKPSADSELTDPYNRAIEAISTHRDNWTSWKSWCLRIGTLLSIASYGLATYVATQLPETI